MLRGWKLVAFLAVIATIEYLIYFQHAGHFFQADTIFWFDHRLKSFADFIHSFAAPDPGGWFRPLTNRTVQSVLFPVVGFNPSPYRWIQFVLFFADIVAVYALSAKLMRGSVGPMIAALFFTIHTINAYTTYDLAFVPELTYTAFYIGSILAYLRYLETERPRFLFVSMLAFGVSLCSKESAVTLPATAGAVALISGWKPKTVLRSVTPLAALLVAYLLLTLGYLHVASEALASIRRPPSEFEAGGYYFMAGPHLISNGLTAWAWGLNLPIGLLGQWRDQTTLRSIVFWGFAVLQMVALICALLSVAWRPVATGFVWFWITVLPALPLRGHFLPYYLLLPVAGFSVMVGASWEHLQSRISSYRPILATSTLVVLLAALTVVCSRTVRSEARNNFLLGRSSRIAESSLRDMRSLFPAIAAGTHFWIQDGSEPGLNFHQADGGLFRLAYGDDSLQFSYSATDAPAPAGSRLLIYKDGHLKKSSD